MGSEAGVFCAAQGLWGTSLPRGAVFVHSLKKNTEVSNHFRVPKAKVSEATVGFCMATPSCKHKPRLANWFRVPSGLNRSDQCLSGSHAEKVNTPP